MFNPSLDHQTSPCKLLPTQGVKAKIGKIEVVKVKEAKEIEGVDGARALEPKALHHIAS